MLTRRAVLATEEPVEPLSTERIAFTAMDVEQRMDSLATFVTAAHWQMVDLHYATTLAQRTITCPLCGHSSPRAGYSVHQSECQFNGGRLERYGCPDCDFVFGPMKMLDLTEQMLNADYRLLYESYQEANSTEAETRAFWSTDPAPGSLSLNWGCGAWSETIDQLRAQGFDVWGYEPAAPPVSPFVVGKVEAISATFDGLFSNNVIEHFRDPVGEFRQMVSHLRPGALMTHATPCYEMLYAHTRFHCSFYLGRSVEVLAEKVGLDVIGRERDGEYQSVTFRVR